MREMYQNEAETSPSSPEGAGGQDRHSGVDPFYDRQLSPPAEPKSMGEQQKAPNVSDSKTCTVPLCAPPSPTP